MKVKELIERLKELDQEAIVVRNGYEGGVCEVTVSNEVEVALNVNTEWYYGEHETIGSQYDEERYVDYQRAKAVYIG